MHMQDHKDTNASQGERIGKIENTISRFTGMASVVTAIFSTFALAVCIIFFSTYTQSVTLKKDIETIGNYTRESSLKSTELEKRVRTVEDRLLALENKVDTHERLDNERKKLQLEGIK